MSYKPNPIMGGTPQVEFNRFLLDELQRISAAFEQVLQNPVTVYKSEPKRVLNLVVAADGTSWNPGGGAGLYYWSGAAWTKL